MKHYYSKILLAAILVAAVACDKTPGENGDETPSLVQKSWTANLESFATKASLNDDLSVKWADGDAISVFSEKRNQKVEQESASGATAVFSGEVYSAETYYALYPYDETATNSGVNITATLPSSQVLVAGGFDPAALLAVARTSDETLSFVNMSALAGISFTGKDIASIAVAGASSDDRIAGKVRINTGTSNITIVTGEERVTLTGTPVSGKTYYAAILPGTYGGLKAVATRTDGLSAEIAIESAEVKIERNTVYKYEVNFDDADWILRPPTGQSYIINGAQELAEFCAFLPTPKEDVVDLTIKGSDITSDMLAKVQERVKSITGTVVWDGVGATTTAGFFDKIECQQNISLENCSALTSVAGLDTYETVGGSLTVKNCPALTEYGFTALASVDGALTFDATGISTFAGSALTSVAGDINVSNNRSLSTLEGLDKLSRIGGNVVIFDNGDIPVLSDEATGKVGFCVIREYIKKNIITEGSVTIKLGKSGNTIELDQLPSCDGSMPGEPQSYVLNGDDEIDAFVTSGVTDEIVKNLTITGRVSSSKLTRLQDRVRTVTGTLLLENLENPNADDWYNTEHFFQPLVRNYVFEGSVVFRNIQCGVNPNGFVNMHEVKGDFILDNVPFIPIGHDGWGGFKGIEKVGGHFKFVNAGNGLFNGELKGFGGDSFAALTEVGGDFVFEGAGMWYFKGGMMLNSIGGDLIIKDCPRFWGLDGFEKLTYLGGNVVLSEYDYIPERSEDWRVGLCILRDFMDSGVMKPTATVTIIKDGEPIDFSTIHGCSYVGEDDRNGGGEKYPDPDPVDGWK